MNIDLTGKTALVTGSTRGIGKAIAKALAESGARVAIVGRNVLNAQSAATELGHNSMGFGCDVTDMAAVTRLVADVEKEFGGIDILVNNAGLTRDNLVMRLKDEDWDEVMNANLRGEEGPPLVQHRGLDTRPADVDGERPCLARRLGVTRRALETLANGRGAGLAASPASR